MDTVMSFFQSIYAIVSGRLSVMTIMYICIAILVLILIWIISRMIKRRKASKRLSDLEIEMNEIRNNSPEFYSQLSRILNNISLNADFFMSILLFFCVL